jgi:hypothetical protein
MSVMSWQTDWNCGHPGSKVSDGANPVETVAYNNDNDWTVLPDIAIEFTTHEPIQGKIRCQVNPFSASIKLSKIESVKNPFGS